MIYQSAHEAGGDPIYHPMLVGEDFFMKSGLAMDLAILSGA